MISSAVYDRLNRLIETIDANGNSLQTEYTPAGKVAAMVNKGSARTEFTYDLRGNLAQTTFPDSTIETHT